MAIAPAAFGWPVNVVKAEPVVVAKALKPAYPWWVKVELSVAADILIESPSEEDVKPFITIL